LWSERSIAGELIGPHRVVCRTDCCRSVVLERASGLLVARADSTVRTESVGIRLAESLSRSHAERILNNVASAKSERLDLDLIEAGRVWKTGGGNSDNRVWWPVVKLASRDEADEMMRRLQHVAGLEPLGFAVVRLDKAEASEPFEFTCGDFSARVLEVTAESLSAESRFALESVPIGRGFHWERKERLEYRGSLRVFHRAGEGLTAVNRLDLETYLESAVGSEMRSDLPPAFSQAQAIAARSTVLATAGRHHYADGFDLCNDDHCQCYQGTQREAGAVVAPVRATAGQVLAFGNRVVDARYAKSCGGVSELYQAAWGEEGPAYFAVRACGDFAVPDLTSEDEARRFLSEPPSAWCNGGVHPYPEPWDKDPLFRWTRSYSRKELGDLIEEKTGKRVGDVRALRVLRRGASGRILILDIEGSVRTIRVFGELRIRQALSPSHLPSSFFVADERGDEIMLHGGGWGHGVGLCQLGACAMAKAGMSAERILAHYYPGSTAAHA